MRMRGRECENEGREGNWITVRSRRWKASGPERKTDFEKRVVTIVDQELGLT